ncbi:hypothetical protein [Kitasatospora cineracea]|uniref:Carbohydrate binding protein n=1 Tax=Kitasatospora cineracea TaxID=88074 RepID=A0A3N4S8A0_9ACTN|nr:hypothetical protein [Kitasatospora cineracea]RPE34910.1 hypothetical protein EDD38_3252 [Kitasatospora cineracea]
MAPVAPLVAGYWPRRLGGLPGPFSLPAGSGDSAAGPLQVELWFDGQWNTITPSVMTRDGSVHVTITRGQSDEAQRTEPATCTMQLNNRLGLYSPRNPLSPLYGKIGRNQPIRVSVPVGNDRNVRFLGEVVAWPQEWDTTGTDVWVPLEAAGVLRRLGQGSRALGSAMYAALASASPTNQVVAYWPFEDASGATVIGSATTGVPGMTISGTPTLATDNSFVCSADLPKMGTASTTAAIPAYTPPGDPGPLSTNPFTTIVRLLAKVPAAGLTDGTVICTWTWTGTIPTWEIYYSTAGSGRLGLRGKDSTGTTVMDTAAGADGVNGTALHLSAEIQLSGGIQLFARLQVTVVGGSTTALTASAFGPTNGLVKSVAVAPGGALGDTVIGHVSLQLSSDVPTDTAATALLAAAYAGEQAATRIGRLCALAGVQFELIGSAATTVAMGPQLSAKLVELINDAVVADAGILYELTSAAGLGYRTRASVENQSPTVSLSYPAGQLAAVPTPVDDDQYIRNDVTASRPGGSSARYTLTSGPLSVAPPPAGVGQYDTTVQVNVQSDSDLGHQTGWRVHLGTVDEPRFPRIAVNLAHPSITVPLRSGILQMRPGDRIAVTGMPSWTSANDVSQLLLGTSEAIDQFQHRLTFNCQPESPYRTAVLEDGALGRLDTAGSQLAASADATATSLSVATTSGPVWSPSLADTPFDVLVAGERVTVTAVGNQLNAAGNPFFAVDLTGWAAQASTIAWSSSVVNSSAGAAGSMQITPDGVTASGGAVGASTGVGSVTPGASYTVALWAYSPGGWSDLRPAADWYDAGGAFISSGLGSGTSVSAGQWTYIQQTLTAPALASYATPRARHGGTPPVSAVWYVWGVRMVAASSVTTSSPQQMTVIRSVNGVVKTQLPGADVRLYQPMILAL